MNEKDKLIAMRAEVTTLLKEHEDRIMGLKERFHFLKRFNEEWDKRLNGAGFKVENVHIAQLIRDCEHMLVIDLASLSRGLLQRGGFLSKLSNFIPILRPMLPEEVPEPVAPKLIRDGVPDFDDSVFVASYKAEKIRSTVEACNEAFARLFPEYIERKAMEKIQAHDISALKDRFENIVKDVINDRDGNRAHRFEDPRKNRSFGAPRMDVQRLESIFLKVENLLNDISHVVARRRLAYPTYSLYGGEEVVADLVDMVLFGTNNRIHLFMGLCRIFEEAQTPYLPEIRDRYYALLHRRYVDRIERSIIESRETAFQEGGGYDHLKVPDLALNDDLPDHDGNEVAEVIRKFGLPIAEQSFLTKLSKILTKAYGRAFGKLKLKNGSERRA